jgi:hypothetical protein
MSETLSTHQVNKTAYKILKGTLQRRDNLKDWVIYESIILKESLQ